MGRKLENTYLCKACIAHTHTHTHSLTHSLTHTHHTCVCVCVCVCVCTCKNAFTHSYIRNICIHKDTCTYTHPNMYVICIHLTVHLYTPTHPFVMFTITCTRTRMHEFMLSLTPHTARSQTPIVHNLTPPHIHVHTHIAYKPTDSYECFCTVSPPLGVPSCALLRLYAV
jgi:hypothetical protein